jgi:hypothetical protein
MNTDIIIVTKYPVDVRNYISGQEFFLYMLMKVLTRHGIHIKIIDINKLIKSYEYCSYNFIHLYYLGFKDIVKLRKLCRKSNMIYHVYHVEDVSWTRMHEFSWKAFLLSIQPLIYAYLATSKSVYTWLRLRAFLARSILIEPYYECPCKTFHSHNYIDIIREKLHDNEIKMLYVGRLNPFRSPPRILLEIAKGVSKKAKKPVRLIIVTKLENLSNINTLKYNNLTINIINRRINDEEKCELYRRSQFFIYFAPWGNVAMNPPITILEAVYHGTIPIVSETISEDLKIPDVFIANSVKEAIDKITLLLHNTSKVVHNIIFLKKIFESFYGEDRFIDAFKRLV